MSNASTTARPEIAQTILAQLGGNKFRVMTGATNFLDLGEAQAQAARPEHDCPAIPARLGGLSFKLGRFAGLKVTHVRVVLTLADLYNVEFFNIRGCNMKTLATVEGIYADQLREVFTRQTGLETSLGTMRA
jgi:uncharacterized protein (UPF0276 family)